MGKSFFLYIYFLLFLYILPSFFQKYVFSSLILLFSQTFITTTFQHHFWGFPYVQNRARREGRKLPKSYVKSTIFSSIACTNVGSLFMSFCCKIFNGSGVMSCQIWNHRKKSILTWKFEFSILIACNSRTTWARKK